MKRRIARLILAVILLLSILASCQSQDERLVTMAHEHADRQAEQTDKVIALQQEIVSGSHELIEADAAAHQRLIEVQAQLQDEQSVIGQQRDQLERDRAALAQRNHSEPVLAAAITGLGWLIALALPLLVCWRLLQPPSGQEDQLVMAELLIEELARDVTVPGADYARIAESKDHSQPRSGA